MGNSLTSAQCFERLAIPMESQTTFKSDVLHQFALYSPMGGNYSGAEAATRTDFTKYYLDKRIHKYQRNGELVLHRTETELFEALLKLVNIWIDEKARQESQRDPSYTASAPSEETPSKKRKRLFDTQGEQSSSTKTPVRPARSPTLANSTEPLQDIPHHGLIDFDAQDDSDGLESLSEIITERPPPAETLTSATPAKQSVSKSTSKGKAPVREPLIPQISKSFTVSKMPRSGRGKQKETPKTNPKTVQRSNKALSIQQAGSSPSCQQAGHSRSFVNMADIEQPMSNASLSPMVPEFPTVTSPGDDQSETIRQSDNPPISTSFDRIHEAPSSANDVQAPESSRAQTTSISLTREERLVDHLYQLLAYIEQCEQHSIRILNHPTSSARERQIHQVRSSSFASLKSDIGSRISAWLSEENNGTGRKEQVTSYCLWSYGTLGEV